MKFLLSVTAIAFLAAVPEASAACTNKFLARAGNQKQEVTLLTGMLTFQEARELAESIDSKKAPSIEWLDDKKRSLAQQFGKLRVLRPMPVGCGEKTSGVVMSLTFMTMNTPSDKMVVKLTPKLIVDFMRQ